MFFKGVSGALTVLMKDAIRPNLMQTLEVCNHYTIYAIVVFSTSVVTYIRYWKF